MIAEEKTAPRQVLGYRELVKLFDFYQEFEIAPFDTAEAQKIDELRGQRLHIGTMDLKSRPLPWFKTQRYFRQTFATLSACQVFVSRIG